MTVLNLTGNTVVTQDIVNQLHAENELMACLQMFWLLCWSQKHLVVLVVNIWLSVYQIVDMRL